MLNKWAATGIRTLDLPLQSQKTYALGYRHLMPGRVGWLIQLLAASTRHSAAQAATARLSAHLRVRGGGEIRKKSFYVPLGNETADNSKHISNICFVSILRNTPIAGVWSRCPSRSRSRPES